MAGLTRERSPESAMPQGKKEEVGDAVFKAHGDKGGDREEHGEELVYEGATAHRQPDRQADQGIAKHTAGEGAGDGELALGHHGGDGQITHRSSTQASCVRHQDQAKDERSATAFPA